MRMGFVAFVLVAMLSFGACEKKDTEEVNDLPEWDFGTPDTLHPTDTGTEEESFDDEYEAPAVDDDVPVMPDDTGSSCGNGFVEKGERCDFAPSDCAKLNPGLTGIAACKQDCSGWRMTECTKKTDVWGVVTLDFYTEYILDDARINDPIYREQGLQRYDAFYGVYADNRPVPAAEAVETWAAASTSPAGGGLYTTFVRQHSFLNGSEIFPYLEIEFPPGPIALADYSVNSTDLIFLNKKLVRFRLVGWSGSSPCIVAMGFWGTIHVNQAWQNNPVEGGRLAIVAETIEFYPPRDLPFLALEEGEPLPDDLLQIMKYPECP